jgi:hypothetical protein
MRAAQDDFPENHLDLKRCLRQAVRKKLAGHMRLKAS